MLAGDDRTLDPAGAMFVSSDRTLSYLRPGRCAVDEELVNVERPQASAEDVRR
jgi:hypothetical protein